MPLALSISERRGAAILDGRDFDETDKLGSAPVAIVNQSFATKYWPGQNAVGKRIRVQVRDAAQRQWRTVVGVASNIMQNDPTRQNFLPLAYLPFRQTVGVGAGFYVRTGGPAGALAAAAREEVSKLDADVTLEYLSTLQANLGFRAERMDIEHVEMGKHAAVAPIFAAIALLLAAIGLYAVVANSVGQTHQRDRSADGDRRGDWRYSADGVPRRDDARGGRAGIGIGGVAGRESRAAIAVGRVSPHDRSRWRLPRRF
ncbi:MAG: ABC transporter permease [Acidobacteriota bacterium]